MAKPSPFAIFLVLSLFSAVTAIASSAQTFTTLVTFDGTNGVEPGYGSLVLGSSGNFYGTTESGGSSTGCTDGGGYGCGTIFEITPTGTLTTLHDFCSELNCADGILPFAGLVKGANGNFYGTTSFGGADGLGTVFEVTPEGTLTTPYAFCSQSNCADGEFPYAGLVSATNGNLYGTTSGGGANAAGTIFEITPGGVLVTPYNFCSQPNCADGEFVFGPLVQGRNGKLYGTTTQGGAEGAGTVFTITLAGKLTTLHTFTSDDGAGPYGGLLETSAGNLLGTTTYGGLRGNGTVFQITPAGKLTTLYNFCVATYCRDGANPLAGLIRSANGNLYGTTNSGGTSFHGTVFEMTPAGKLTTLYNFCSKADCTDGEYPLAGLVQSADGILYGTTEEGGGLACHVAGYSCGTIFSLVP